MHINIEKLVDDIHAAETARREGGWTDFCRARGMGRTLGSYYFPANYADYVTGLYTLRAWVRGRLHRKNPPAAVRDFNRSMRETGRERRCIDWDAKEHNRELAENVAANYELEEAVSALG